MRADDAEALIKKHLYGGLPPVSEGNHWLFIIDNANDVEPVVVLPSLNKAAARLVAHAAPSSVAGRPARVPWRPNSAQLISSHPPPAANKQQQQSLATLLPPPPPFPFPPSPPPRPVQQQQQQRQQQRWRQPQPPRQQNQASATQKAARLLPPLPPFPPAPSSSYDKWSVEELVRWARDMGCGSAAEMFQTHEIDGSAIGDLAYIGRDAVGLLRVMREVRWNGKTCQDCSKAVDSSGGGRHACLVAPSILHKNDTSSSVRSTGVPFHGAQGAIQADKSCIGNGRTGAPRGEIGCALRWTVSGVFSFSYDRSDQISYGVELKCVVRSNSQIPENEEKVSISTMLGIVWVDRTDIKKR